MSGIMTVLAQRGSGAVQSLDSFSILARVFNAIWAYLWYILKTFWPRQLALYYPHSGYGLSPVQVFGSLLVLTGISYLAIRYARRCPYLFVGWFIYLGMLVPVIGLVQVGSQAMADRYSYVPLIGLFLIVAWGLPDLLAGRRHGNAMLWCGGIIALVLLAVLSSRQVGHWRDSKTLFAQALAATENNPVMLNSLGVIYIREGDLEKGMAYVGRALSIVPGFGLAHGNMGAAMARTGHLELAAFHYRQAIRHDANLAFPHFNYAAILVRQNRPREAMHHLSEAIRINPDYASAYVLSGYVLLNAGDIDRARLFFQQALLIDPANVDARRFLSNME